MASVRVVGSEKDREGQSINYLTTNEILAEDSIKQISSLPAISTHIVGLSARAGYKDFGESPEELRLMKTPLSDSMSKVEDSLVKSALNKPIASQRPRSPEENIPSAITWSTFRVCEWISNLGFPHYVGCFKYNFVDGKKLIHFRGLNAFPKIGVTDFNDMKSISAAVRKLLLVEKPKFYQYLNYVSTRSISLPEEKTYEMYLEDKARTGKGIDKTDYTRFREMYKTKYDRAWDLPKDERKWRQFKKP